MRHRLQTGFPMTVAITAAITSLAEAERRFDLIRTEDEAFFAEWQQGLPALVETEQAALNELRRRYLYQRSESQLLESTVTFLLESPLLTEAGFYDPPIKIRLQPASWQRHCRF